MNPDLRDHIFYLKNREEFDSLSLRIFNFQAERNNVYKEYLKGLNFDRRSVMTPDEIPFLPIGFFRTHRVITGGDNAVLSFESSGTTGAGTSRHFISDPQIYQKSFVSSFRCFYGEPGEYFFAALLPSYADRENSSLVYMVDHLINMSRDSRSSFFLNDAPKLLKTLKEVKNEGKKIMLIGVSHALLDLAEKHSPDLSGITVVETGGMKGRRKEITREELHSALKEGFNIEEVHSEYGMTELLSQAWSKGRGIFKTPAWMKIYIRDSYDPLSLMPGYGMTGGINIIDLANIDSCSFIATGDLGKLHSDGSFEVLGRFDNADIRGCNLLTGQ
jgi:hypothetical protein